MSMKSPRVSVYIPCHNYGRYLEQAIKSVISQSFPDWELIVIDDGSDDETAEIIATFVKKDSRIQGLTHTTPRGLQYSANEALRLARGDYFMRLDADDYLDDNALLVMATYLDQHAHIALVYPNYIYVDEAGNILGVENRKRIGHEAKVLDLPAHGACTMVRRCVIESVGGYDEQFDRQDGHELWLKVLMQHKVGNVTTPLFYYRQHEASITRDEEKLLAVRASIKRNLVKHNGPAILPKTIAVIGAKNTYRRFPNIVLSELAGKTLLEYTVEEALAVERINTVVVTTDDHAVVDYCEQRFPSVIPLLRPVALSTLHIRESDVLLAAIDELIQRGFQCELVVSLSIHCPLRQAVHIQKAIDTLLLYELDSVISVYEDQDLHYVHGKYGLEELNPAMHRQIRVEREALFVDNGAIRIFWRDLLKSAPNGRQKVGHIVMSKQNSIQIKSQYDAWLIEKILQQRQTETPLTPESWKG